MAAQLCHGFLVQIVLLLSVSSFFAVSDTRLSPSDDAMDDLLTGHVQIKRDSIPTEVLPCLAETAIVPPGDCPFRQSQWNNMHCLNNSFGMFTNENKFVNFGADPLGIVFPHLFFNPVSTYSGCSESDSSDSDEKLERIEALLKINAEASANITLLDQLLRDLQRNKEQLEQELKNVKQANLEQKEQIHLFKTRAERLEEIHEECTTSYAEQRNATSIALRAAQDHITQLKNENKLFMDANSECSSDLKSSEDMLSKVRNKNHENELALARCSTSLALSQESEEEVQKKLVEEEEEHSKHLQEHQEERRQLISEKQNVQITLVSCEASLTDIRNTYEQYKKKYETCLEDAGETKVQLQICTSALDLCRGNHSLEVKSGDVCERAHRNCLSDAAHLKEALTACENNTKTTDKVLKSLKADNEKSTVRIASLQSELENVKGLEDDFNSDVKSLKARLDKEKSAYSDMHAKARQCSLDLVTAQTSRDTARDRANDISGKLDDLRKKYDSLSNMKFKIETGLSALTERCTLLKVDHDKCQSMLNDASSYVDRLVETKTGCETQLSNVTTSLSIVELQRNECLEKHHYNVNKTDHWRARWEKTNEALGKCILKNVNCTTDLDHVNKRFESLEEEADEMQKLNVNLNDRLNATLESLSSVSKNNKELRETLAIQIKITEKLGKQVAGLQSSLDAETKAHQICLKKLQDSKDEVTTLGQKITELSDASVALQAELNQCSQDLNDTQIDLQEQKRLYADLEKRLLKVQNELKLLTSLHNSAKAEVKTLHLQLNMCRGNHSESLSEAQSWENQFIQCSDELRNERADCIREADGLEERFMNCESDKKNVSDSLQASILANKRCQSDKASLNERLQALSRSFQASTTHITLFRRRMSNLEVVIKKLQSDSRAFKSRVNLLNRQHEMTRGQLTLCREEKEKQGLQVVDLTDELEKCHSSASSAFPQPFPYLGECPSSEQGSYVSSSTGCLLVTGGAGSQSEMEALCGGQAGGRLLTPQLAAMSQLQHELPRLKAPAGHPAPAAVWLSAMEGADGRRHCQDLKMQSTGGQYAVQDRPCHDRLPGLCVTEHETKTMTDTQHIVMNISSSGPFEMSHGPLEMPPDLSERMLEFLNN